MDAQGVLRDVNADEGGGGSRGHSTASEGVSPRLPQLIHAACEPSEGSGSGEAGIATLLARLHDLRPAALVLEATGGYEVWQHPHTAGSLPRLFMVSGPGLTIDNRP